jgi:dTDP-4-amino-4,6-dideoxygalactose transaminase
MVVTDTPALLGGPPVFPDGPPDWPFPDLDVRASLESALADGSWGKYNGPFVPDLEEALAAFHRVPHVLTCSSGTLAVEVAVRALKAGPGDEVIVPAYDYEANFLSVHAVGAQPVLVDVLPEDACLDPGRIEAALSPATKAIVVSHLHGGLMPMARVRAIADHRGIAVIEDAAQATGATVEGKKAGSWGDVGILSFGGSKLLSAGRGGALLIHKPEVWQRAKVWLSRGVQQWAALSEVQAAVLLPQLAKLPERTAHRLRQVERLIGLLKDIPGLRPFSNELPESEPAFYKLGFFLDESAFGLKRETFVNALRAEGVAFDEGFRAVHVARGANRFRAAGPLLEAERAHHSVVMLHHPVLSLGNEEVDKVAQAVRKTYRNVHRLAGR